MKLFYIKKKLTVLVSVSLTKRGYQHIFRWFKGLSKVNIEKIVYFENIKSNELSLVFSKIVSKGLCCDKVWGISIFPSCRPIRGILQKVALNNIDRAKTDGPRGRI